MKIEKIALMAAGALCLLGGINVKIVFAESKNDSLAPFMEESVVVGKWGAGDKEFGFNKRADGPDVGPNAITTDKAENIYVLDPVNKRIVVYAKTGKYSNSIPLQLLKKYQIYNSLGNSLAVDSSGSIFLFTQNRDFYDDSVVVKIDQQGKLLRQYASVSPLKDKFGSASPKFHEHFNKIKNAPGMSVLPETVGKLIKPVVDIKGNVYALAEQGILIPLSQETTVKMRSRPGHPMENNENYFVRDPETPLTKYHKEKPAPIKRLLIKSVKGETVAVINSEDIKKYLPSGATIDDIQYKGSDGAGNMYFLIFAEGAGTRCFIVRFASDWHPTALTAIRDISSYPFVISHDGNVFQLVWDSDKLNDGVRILKWMAKP